MIVKFLRNILAIFLAACSAHIAMSFVDSTWQFAIVCIISGFIAGTIGTGCYCLIAVMANFPIAGIIVFGIILDWNSVSRSISVNPESYLCVLIIFAVPPVVAEIVGRRMRSVPGVYKPSSCGNQEIKSAGRCNQDWETRMLRRRLSMYFITCYCCMEICSVLIGLDILTAYMFGGLTAGLLFYVMLVERWRSATDCDSNGQWNLKLGIAGVMYVLPLILAIVGSMSYLLTFLSIALFIYVLIRFFLRFRAIYKSK